MVKVKGQIDTPLIDMSHIREEYWQRKEVYLPSVAKFMPKKKVWFGLREVEQKPMIVLRRLSEEEWRSINERFWKTKENSFLVILDQDLNNCPFEFEIYKFCRDFSP